MDIVENLRGLSRGDNSDFSLGDEAADEITRLRAERDQWKELYLAAMRIVAEFEGTFSSPPRDETK